VDNFIRLTVNFIWLVYTLHRIFVKQKQSIMRALIEHIEMGLKNGRAPYITAVDADGDNIKIRVRDHSCNQDSMLILMSG